MLTPQEAEHLFTTLDRLSAEGCSILYISHKLEEVRRSAAAPRSCAPGAWSPPRSRASSAREIAALMVGSEVGEIRTDAPHRPEGELLRVAALSCRPQGCTAWR